MDELNAMIASNPFQRTSGSLPSNFHGVGVSQTELDTILRTVASHNESFMEQNLEAVYPLSPMQQGMVFHSLYAPNSGVYLEQTTFTIQGNIDLEAFENAWQRVIARHTVLRTSFFWQGLDRMLQVVQKNVQLPVEILDWRHLSDEVQQTRLDSLLQTERSHGFDLTTPPLLRLVLIKEADDRLRVLFNHHHAILDGWSLPLLFREVFDLYTATIRYEDPSFSPVRPYENFIKWLQTRDQETAQSFWCKELDGFVSAPLFPDQASPFAGASHPAEQELGLSFRTTTALQTFVRQNQLTLNTLLQDAWALVLSHLSQRDDVAFGVTVAGRSADFPGAMNMIGLFINTLPLRVQVPSDSPVLSWLRRIRDRNLELQQYDYIPLAQIQTWSGIAHASPLFDNLFIFENYPTHAAAKKQFDSLQIGNIQTIEQINYPLTIAVLPGEQLTIKILYSEGHFATDMIQRLLRQYCQVLESLIINPDQPLSNVMKMGEILGPWKILSGDATSEKHADPGATQRTSGIPKIETSTKYAEASLSTTRLEEYLKRLWCRLLKVESVGIHDHFFEMGGDSLNGAIYISQIQDALKETIPLSAIFDFPTIFELARYLEQEYPDGTAHLLGFPVSETSAGQQEVVHPATLVAIQPEGKKSPLFCIHPAGGIVFPYYTLAPYLGKEQPLYGLQDPRLYDSQAPFNTIESLATHYIEVIKTIQPEGPYNLLGWSFGGLVAFEMAQQLTRLGQTIAHLIFLDTKAPALNHIPRRSALKKEGWHPNLSWMLALPSQVKAISHAIGPIASYIRSGLFLLSAAVKPHEKPTGKKLAIKDLLDWIKFVAWRNRLLKEAEVAGAISQEASLLLVEMPAVQRILRLVREHIRLGQQYVAQQYPGRITLFYAAKSSHSETEVPALGWDRLAKGGVDVHNLQTNHVALLVKPNVEILANDLKASLAEEHYPV